MVGFSSFLMAIIISSEVFGQLAFLGCVHNSFVEIHLFLRVDRIYLVPNLVYSLAGRYKSQNAYFGVSIFCSCFLVRVQHSLP
jgi:hypothetical protein